MILMILIIFLLINLLPALYFGKKYSDLKKKTASNQDFEKLSDSMMHVDKFIIPLSIIIVIMLYFIK
ncbi:hypothetical protein [Staphylococcus sp. GDH8C109P]|uniref:hypothetical protein n=1 Tax=Staphylococcus sp. GDH8C109P TaxID=2804088 RepID=UPI001AEC288D|nr:hypothetical protein [Staphylococcus sp. GDH8C109P]